MCQKCVDAIQKYWPNLPETDWHDLLWAATAYPFGDGDYVAAQVKEKAEQSGQDLGCAMAIAEAEMDLAMLTVPEEQEDERDREIQPAVE